jgi:hypothetical protein
MSKNKHANWPFVGPVDETAVEIFTANFANLQENDLKNDGIMVITDGWQEGEAAAILRGGVNARAVLDVLAAAGLKHLKIFHLEERLPELEEVFLSSVVGPANALFDSVSVECKPSAMNSVCCFLARLWHFQNCSRCIRKLKSIITAVLPLSAVRISKWTMMRAMKSTAGDGSGPMMPEISRCLPYCVIIKRN